MKQNLIISNGYYTTLVAVSILKQLNLNNSFIDMLAYFKQLDSSYNENEALSKKAWNFNNVINYNTFNVSKRFNFKEFSKKFLSYDNILIPINSSSKKWFKGFKEVYPKANFIFYEEGLLSYIKPLMDKGLKKIIDNYSAYYNNFNKNFLSLVNNNLNIKVIENCYFEESLKDLKDLIKVSFINLGLNTGKNILFLPQYYGNNSKVNHLNKIKKYASLINKLLLKGYRVLIKDHPKYHDINLDNYLMNKLNKNSNLFFLNNISKYPVELFLNDLNVNLIFSVYSTTLLTASSSIFNLPVFTSYTMLKERINSFSLYPSLMCNLINITVPDLDNFLGYYRDDPKKYYNNFINRSSYIGKLKIKDLLIKFLFKN